LPLCHPLIIDAVRVACDLDQEKMRVVVRCEVISQGRTGVEMEALTAVSAALLCIYDLTKGLNKGATISGIMLEQKEGGKSGTWRNPTLSQAVKPDRAMQAQKVGELQGIRSAVLTVSDSCARGQNIDESGKLLSDFIKKESAELVGAQVIPDDIEKIRSVVEGFTKAHELDLLLITGGTGIGPRDVTPDAVKPLWSKLLPGFGELFRRRGAQSTPHAWISRAEAGIIGKTIVVLLPGSPSGVRDGIAILSDKLPHMLKMIRGDGH
jgi:cyclic pyranopterin phosphate synthase